MVMVMTGTSPVLAGADKHEVCHFDADFNPSGKKVVKEGLGWIVIEISHSAVDSHVGKHTDGGGDFVELVPDTISAGDCDARNA